MVVFHLRHSYWFSWNDATVFFRNVIYLKGVLTTDAKAYLPWPHTLSKDRLLFVICTEGFTQTETYRRQSLSAVTSCSFERSITIRYMHRSFNPNWNLSKQDKRDTQSLLDFEALLFTFNVFPILWSYSDLFCFRSESRVNLKKVMPDYEPTLMPCGFILLVHRLMKQ